MGSTAYDAQMCGFDSHILKDLTRSVAPASEQAMMERLLKIGVEIHDSVDFLQEYLSAPQPLACQRKTSAIKSENEDVDEKALCL